ncbi:MAG: hypothetical protein CM15mP110_3450 [Alphaproteobacteria bacterium]|nr:MAG: hypothetical protein CM15mP110_3450 [Alphaproteobacteria bacterium]
MKWSYFLKEKAKRRKMQKQQRNKNVLHKRTELEKPDKPKKDSGGGLNFEMLIVGMLQGILGFFAKFLFATIIVKLVDFVNSCGQG